MPAAKTCTVDGCERKHAARGWCIGHYNRWLRDGDIGTSPLEVHTGADHHNWAGDQPSYDTIHQRLASQRGPASARTCVACDGSAAHWAYDHEDAREAAA